MRPEICEFISDAVYDGRLKSDACTSDRSIRLRGPVQYVPQPAGIVYVPVDHSGHTYDCDEEAEFIRRIVAELCGHMLEERSAAPRAITVNDILVVAPFNLQVRKLQPVLGGVRVGTVDKFQGQQAPVVIFSMTSSEGDASPRGIEFLFDKHRLNVAISRAQVLAVVVGSPALERTRCSNLEQMQAVNTYCRAVESGASRFIGGNRNVLARVNHPASRAPHIRDADPSSERKCWPIYGHDARPTARGFAQLWRVL